MRDGRTSGAPRVGSAYGFRTWKTPGRATSMSGDTDEDRLDGPTPGGPVAAVDSLRQDGATSVSRLSWLAGSHLTNPMLTHESDHLLSRVRRE